MPFVAGDNVVIIEDVITTGKSTREVMDIVKAHGAKLAGIASIVDRSDGAAVFEENFYSLLKINIRTYRPEQCPLCKEGKSKAVKPGSRT